MSELIVGDGYLKLVEPEYRMEPEIRAEMREAVAAYRETQAQCEGFRQGMRVGCWIGFIGSIFLWLWALYGVIALRDVLASAWRAW